MSRLRKTDQRFPLPTVVDPPRKCISIQIPQDDNHEKAFFAALDELSKYWVWEWDGNKTGKEAANVWKEIIYNAAKCYYFSEGCCEMGCNDCYQDINNSVTIYYGNIEIVNTWIEQFITSGETSVINIFNTDAPEMGAGHDSLTEAMMCFIVGMYINSIADSGVAAFENPQPSIWDSVASIANDVQDVFLAGSVLIPFLPAQQGLLIGGAAVAATIAKILATQIAAGAIDEDLADALADQAARDEVICCLATFMSDSISVRPWLAWRTLVLTETSCGTMSANGTKLRQFFRSIFLDPSMYVSIYKIMDDADLLEAANELPAGCPCDDTWCYLFDFADDPGDMDFIETSGYGQWISGTGWVGTYDSALNSMRIALKRSWTPANITSIRSTWFVSGSTTNPKQAKQELFSGENSVAAKANSLYDVGTEFNLFNDPIDVTADNVELTIDPGADRGNGGTTLELRALRFTGTGECPFGIPNC